MSKCCPFEHGGHPGGDHINNQTEVALKWLDAATEAVADQQDDDAERAFRVLRAFASESFRAEKQGFAARYASAKDPEAKLAVLIEALKYNGAIR